MEDGLDKVNELPDSLEWGTASKGAKKKIYGDALKGVDDMKTKIKNMKELESLAIGGING